MSAGLRIHVLLLTAGLEARGLLKPSLFQSVAIVVIVALLMFINERRRPMKETESDPVLNLRKLNWMDQEMLWPVITKTASWKILRQ